LRAGFPAKRKESRVSSMWIEGRDFKQGRGGGGGREQCFRQGIKGRREERYIFIQGRVRSTAD
jgi:hypothetical protein